MIHLLVVVPRFIDGESGIARVKINSHQGIENPEIDAFTANERGVYDAAEISTSAHPDGRQGKETDQ
jgi:hypothetical protein